MKDTHENENKMTRSIRMLTIFLVPVAALILGIASPSCFAGDNDVIEFDEAEIFFEFNSTDNDLGIQIFFDAEGWKEVKVLDPSEEEIFEVENDEGLKEIGSAEVFTESAEPELCPDEEENSCNLAEAIAEFQAKFSEGLYILKGETVEGDELEGEAELAWELPAAPVIIAPTELPGDPPNPYVVTWEEQPNGGPEIIGYEVVAELVIKEGDEDLTLVNTAMLLESATNFTVSPEFVALIVAADADESLLEFKVEIIARAENLNKTITELVIFEIEEEE